MTTQLTLKPIEISIFPDGRMDAANTSKYTRLSAKTLAMMRCDGSGPRFIKRGRIFYFKEDVDEWLNAGGRHVSTAQQSTSARKGVRP